jgi:HEAT repeat protein
MPPIAFRLTAVRDACYRKEVAHLADAFRPFGRSRVVGAAFNSIAELFAMRTALLVLVMTCILASAATARQWTSRNGGFSVEAELVDVKDGKVILKKTDGAQISVPLGKLSLGDVRYINDVLKSAEAGITEGKAESPAAASAPAAVPAPAALKPPSEPASEPLKPADLAKLRYQWKRGQTFVYHVRILGDRGHEIENRSGEVTYKVKSIQHDEIALTMNSDLKHETSEYQRRYVVIPGRHVRFYSDIDRPKEATITVDPSGRLLESKGEAPLPYLLGDLSELIVEPLSPTKQPSWTITGDPGVAVVAPFYPYCRYSLAGFREGIPAVEKTTYTVLGEDGRLITIAKRYEMTSATTIEGKPRLEASGQGRLKFDTQRGMFDSLDFNMRVVVRDSNKTEEVPLRISYRLLSEEDIARAKREAAEAKKEAEAARQEKLRPLGDKEVDTLLSDLASGEPERVEAAFKLLGDKTPQQPNPKVAKALESLLTNGDNAGIRGRAAGALKQWSTPESVPALIKALHDEWAPVRAGAIEALCKYSPKAPTKLIAQQLTDPFARGAAVKFLKAAGPEAEDYVLPYLSNNSDAWVRSDVCTILGAIGTKKSLPALEKAALEDNWMVNGNAKKAMAAIKSRE